MSSFEQGPSGQIFVRDFNLLNASYQLILLVCSEQCRQLPQTISPYLSDLGRCVAFLRTVGANFVFAGAFGLDMIELKTKVILGGGIRLPCFSSQSSINRVSPGIQHCRVRNRKRLHSLEILVVIVGTWRRIMPTRFRCVRWKKFAG